MIKHPGLLVRTKTTPLFTTLVFLYLVSTPPAFTYASFLFFPLQFSTTTTTLDGKMKHVSTFKSILSDCCPHSFFPKHTWTLNNAVIDIYMPDEAPGTRGGVRGSDLQPSQKPAFSMILQY